jgi:hypothetical protein
MKEEIIIQELKKIMPNFHFKLTDKVGDRSEGMEISIICHFYPSSMGFQNSSLLLELNTKNKYAITRIEKRKKDFYWSNKKDFFIKAKENIVNLISEELDRTQSNINILSKILSKEDLSLDIEDSYLIAANLEPGSVWRWSIESVLGIFAENLKNYEISFKVLELFIKQNKNYIEEITNPFRSFLENDHINDEVKKLIANKTIEKHSNISSCLDAIKVLGIENVDLSDKILYVPGNFPRGIHTIKEMIISEQREDYSEFLPDLKRVQKIVFPTIESYKKGLLSFFQKFDFDEIEFEINFSVYFNEKSKEEEEDLIKDFCEMLNFFFERGKKISIIEGAEEDEESDVKKIINAGYKGVLNVDLR